MLSDPSKNKPDFISLKQPSDVSGKINRSSKATEKTLIAMGIVTCVVLAIVGFEIVVNQPQKVEKTSEIASPFKARPLSVERQFSLRRSLREDLFLSSKESINDVAPHFSQRAKPLTGNEIADNTPDESRKLAPETHSDTSEINEQLKELEDRLSASIEKIKLLENTNQGLSLLADTHQKELTASIKAKQEAEEEFQQVSEELDSLKKSFSMQREEFQSKLTWLEQQTEISKEELKLLTAIVESGSIERVSLTKQLSEITAEKDALMTKSQQLESELHQIAQAAEDARLNLSQSIGVHGQERDELTSLLNNLEAIKQEHEQQIVSTSAEVQRLNALVEQKNQELIELTSSHATLQRGFMVQIDNLTNQLSDAQTKEVAYQELQRINNEHALIVQELKGKVIHLEDDLSASQDLYSMYQERSENLELELSELQKKNVALLDQLRDLKTAYEADKSAAEETITKLTQELEDQKALVNNLKDTNEYSSENESRLRELIQEKMNKANEQESLIAMLTEKTERATTLHEEGQQTIESLQQETSNEKQRVDELLRQLENQTANFSELNVRERKLQEELDEKYNKIKDLEQKVEEYKKSSDQKEQTSSELTYLLEELQLRVNQEEDKSLQLNNELTASQEKIDALLKELDQSKQRLEEKEATFNQLELEKSAAWNEKLNALQKQNGDLAEALELQKNRSQELEKQLKLFLQKFQKLEKEIKN